MLAALVSQLCEKELREERCLLESPSLSGWAGTHVEMFRGNFRLEMWSSGAGENEGETYFSGEEIIGKEDWKWRMVLRHLGRGKEPAWKTEERIRARSTEAQRTILREGREEQLICAKH